MKRYIFLLTSSLLLIILSTSLGVSQKNNNSKTKKSNPSTSNKTTASKPAYDTKPFNTNLESLPPQYIGNDIELIFDTLFDRQKSGKKGEYETTEQYRLRLNAEKLSPIIGDLDVGSIFAFRLDEIKTEYDADNESLNVYFIPTLVFEDFDARIENFDKYKSILNENIRAVELKSNVSYEKYLGMNSFGVRKEVTRILSYDYQLSITNWKNFIDEKYTKPKEVDDSNDSTSKLLSEMRSKDPLPYKIPITASLPTNAATAKSIRNNLRGLLVCKLVEPYLSTYGSLKEPTIDSPTEHRIQYLYLNVKLLEYWVFNNVSGEVYLKVREKVKVREKAQEQIVENERIKAKDEIEPLKIISKPKPQYTMEARKNKVVGTVELTVTFLASGQIGEIKIISGLPNGLTEEVIKSVKQIKFEPEKKMGVSIDVTKTLKYSFL